MINQIKIENFRGLNVTTDLKRINIITGENGSGKTSFLEAVFITTLFQSNLSDKDISNLFFYALKSRGDMVSAFITLSDSKITFDGTTTQFKRLNFYTYSIEINNEKVAEIRITKNNELETLITKRTETKYFPVYISSSFDNYGNPETIYSIIKRRLRSIGLFGGADNLEILQDEFGEYKLYYMKRPGYIVGKGLLKKELLRLILTTPALFSIYTLLVDELENSLYPDVIMDILMNMRSRNDIQIFFTTNSNEVIKTVAELFNDEEAQLLYLTRKGCKAYKISEIKDYNRPLKWLGYV